MKDFDIIHSGNTKYGRYYIPSSDYSLDSPYSSTSRCTVLSRLESWLYRVYSKAKETWTDFTREEKTQNSQSKSIDWVAFIGMIPFYGNEPLLLSGTVEPLNLVNTFVTVNHDLTLEIYGKKFYFPSDSRFIMSDLEVFSKIIQDKYSLVLIDPPWPNISVSRSKMYKTMDIYNLYNLKLNKITKSGSLVAIWVSNHPKYQEFIKEKFFSNYGIKLIEEWYWIKVTRKGDLVVSFSDLSHRKPFEILYIGKVTKQTMKSVQRKVLISVPSKYHSRKPFIHGTFSLLIVDLLSMHPEFCEGRRLECFARNLYSGWTSWGNEVLKFNDLDYLQQG